MNHHDHLPQTPAETRLSWYGLFSSSKYTLPRLQGERRHKIRVTFLCPIHVYLYLCDLVIGFDMSIQSCGHRLFKGLLQAVLKRVGYNKAQAWIGSHRPSACFQTKGGLLSFPGGSVGAKLQLNSGTGWATERLFCQCICLSSDVELMRTFPWPTSFSSRLSFRGP